MSVQAKNIEPGKIYYDMSYRAPFLVLGKKAHESFPGYLDIKILWLTKVGNDDAVLWVLASEYHYHIEEINHELHTRTS